MADQKARPTAAPRANPDRPVQDEWGIFDPQQAGMAAVIRKLLEQADSTGSTPSAIAHEAERPPKKP